MKAENLESLHTTERMYDAERCVRCLVSLKQKKRSKCAVVHIIDHNNVHTLILSLLTPLVSF